MAEPYIKKDPGDIIRAQDWNDMQSRARDAIEGHTHTGGGQGSLLTGAAIDPVAALKVKSVTADTLSIAGADLSASLKNLLDRVNAALPLAGGTVTGELIARGGIRLNDAEIQLHSDGNHGLGYYGTDKRFAGQAPDGPVLYGFAGGGLGSMNGGPRLALSWDAQQNVTVNKALTVADSITAAGSDLYFTRTDHKHSGKGNTAGLAAIENAGDYGALMILGRAGSKLPGGGTGRYVRLFDYLQVDGSATIANNLSVKGRIGINTDDQEPKAALQVRGGAIMAHHGNTEDSGFTFLPDAFGGSGDRAWIRWHNARGGESTTLEIGVSNDGDDHIVLNPSGNVGIGVDAPSSKLHVNGMITHNGIRQFSDERLKTDLQPIANPLAAIMHIEPKRFRWKKDGPEGRRDIGVIAQDVEAVLPEIVAEDNDGYKTVNYTGLIAMLLAAVRQQQQQIDDLKERLTR